MKFDSAEISQNSITRGNQQTVKRTNFKMKTKTDEFSLKNANASGLSFYLFNEIYYILHN